MTWYLGRGAAGWARSAVPTAATAGPSHRSCLACTVPFPPAARGRRRRCMPSGHRRWPEAGLSKYRIVGSCINVARHPPKRQCNEVLPLHNSPPSLALAATILNLWHGGSQKRGSRGVRHRDRDHAPPLAHPSGRSSRARTSPSPPPTGGAPRGGSTTRGGGRKGDDPAPTSGLLRGVCLRLSCGRAAWARRGTASSSTGGRVLRSRRATPPAAPHRRAGWAAPPHHSTRRRGFLLGPSPSTGDLTPLGRGLRGRPTPHPPTHGWGAGRLGEVFPLTSNELGAPATSHGRGGGGELLFASRAPGSWWVGGVRSHSSLAKGVVQGGARCSPSPIRCSQRQCAGWYA